MKTIKKFVTFIIVASMVVSNFVGVGSITVNAARKGIVKNPEVEDDVDSFTTTLDTGESTTISIKNHVLSIQVNSTNYTFKVDNISSITNQAVVNEKSGLLHILTVSNVYYCFDLYTGVQIRAYCSNENNGYCSSNIPDGYIALGKSLIDNTRFYKIFASDFVATDYLMTRTTFDSIITSEKPAIDNTESTPTAEPTVKVTPTAEPTTTLTPIPEPTPTVTPSPTKESYSVKQKGQKVQLMRSYNGKTEAISTIVFNKMKGTAKFNNHTYKKVKDCGYSQKSHQVILLMKNGSIKVLPTGKGKIRTYKGSYSSLKNSADKLIIKAKTKGNKNLSLKNVKPVSK